MIRAAGHNRDVGRRLVSASVVTMDAMEVVLRTRSPDGVDVILSALIHAKILEEHSAAADLDLIDRTVREPDERRRDPRPGRERFFPSRRRPLGPCRGGFRGVPAIIVTVFSAERPPT